MRRARFKQVDVFTERPFLGNPVAVVLDAESLSDQEMARIAAWTNLSETTFVSPSPRADYRLRIFTPRAELPFAGHPTLGTAHAVREAGLVPAAATSVVQECGAGLVSLSVGPAGLLSLKAPTARTASFPAERELARALGHSVRDPLIIDVGPRWVVGALEDGALLRGLRPDLRAIEELSRSTDITGVTVFAVVGDGVEVRSFAPAHGVPEDPVCGSGNISVAVHRRATGAVSPGQGARWLARQGSALGRAGEMWVDVREDGVTISGSAVTVIDGEIRLD